ncbi:hypothetical protein V2J09_014921 [Rumex salicifolius]
MGAPAPGFATRLKRENCRRTKHDSSFSKWKILIGASDWEEHCLRKEGAERYRIQNLPVSPGPGVYEIGVGVWAGQTGSGRDLGKLDPDRIVAVYLGQAENVRSRLQSYGRGGAHLDDASSTGLFKHIFARGFPILYRWAPMSSKKDAERTEAELLAYFDYAWNKVSNGMKRPSDVILKIEEVSSSATLNVLKMLKSLTEKKVGIPIKPNIPSSPPNKMSHDDNLVQGVEYKFGLLARVLKFGRYQPRTVVPRDDVDAIASNACGVNLGDGTVCRNQAVEGRKRCPEHKGKKKNASNVVDLDSPSKQSQTDMLFVPICGVILLDGSPCTKNPVKGRKRCEEHKGKRIQTPKLSYHEASTIDVDLEKAIMEKESMSRRAYGSNCCGVMLSYGSYCKRDPVKGRKRCEEHKGMRIHDKLDRNQSAFTVLLQ